MLAIKVEQRPIPKVVASRFIATAKAKAFESFESLWQGIVSSVLTEEEAAVCGTLIRAVVNSGELKGTEIAGDDPVAPILDMDVKALLFLVRSREVVVELEAPPPSALARLSGGSMLQPLPDWADAGHPAYTAVYGMLKDQLVADGVKGLSNASQGSKFLISLTKLLFHLSTFWDKFKDRRASLPEYFSTTKGANDYAGMKKKVRLFWLNKLNKCHTCCPPCLLHVYLFHTRGDTIPS